MKYVPVIIILVFAVCLFCGSDPEADGKTEPVVDDSAPTWVSLTGITAAIGGDGEVTAYYSEAHDTHGVEYFIYTHRSVAELWEQTPLCVEVNGQYTVAGLTNGQRHFSGVQAIDSYDNLETNSLTRYATPGLEDVDPTSRRMSCPGTAPSCSRSRPAASSCLAIARYDILGRGACARQLKSRERGSQRRRLGCDPDQLAGVSTDAMLA